MRTLEDNRGRNYWDIFTELPGQLNAVFSKRGVKRGLHRHQLTDEKFLILSGQFLIEKDDQISVGEPGSIIEIPRNTWHGFEALKDGWFIYYENNKFNPDDQEEKEWL